MNHNGTCCRNSALVPGFKGRASLGWIARWMVAIVLAAGTHAAANADVLSSAGIWTAFADQGAFADVGTLGTARIALVLPAQSHHFALRLTRDGWGVPSGTPVVIQAIFSGGDTFVLEGAGSGDTIQADIPDMQLASWTHNFTAMGSMTVSIGGWPEPPWSIPLSGTTATITAMAKALEVAGTTDLPRPWGTATATQQSIPGGPGPIAAPVTPEHPAVGSAAPSTSADQSAVGAAPQKVPYGSRAGMEATVTAANGLGTTRATIIARLTADNARRFCTMYVPDTSQQCVDDTMNTTRLADRIIANCETGEFTTFAGATLRFVGKSDQGSDSTGGLRHRGSQRRRCAGWHFSVRVSRVHCSV